MKKLLILVFTLVSLKVFSQDWPVKRFITDRVNRGESFTAIPAFSFSADRELTGRGTYGELQLNAAFLRQIMEQQPGAIEIKIPLSRNGFITCELAKFSLGNIKFTENNNKIIEKLHLPVTYRGIIRGEQQKNTVTLTVNDDYLSVVATTGTRSIQITKADEPGPLTYRLYNSQQVRFPVLAFNCGTGEMAASQTPDGILLNGMLNRTETVQEKCVNVFIDCFDSLYQWRGSNRQQTINYVYELYNLVTTGYLNDSINIQIVGINVWTTTDPYRGDTREHALADVATYYKDDFWGNIGIGMDYSVSGNGRSGIAGGIGRVKATSPGSCPAYVDGVDNPFCYCDEKYNVTVQNFPTGPNATQQQVYLTMHEMGHLLGAHHTKWCGWQLTPTTTGTLDSCGAIEGSCAQGPPPPANGATIMSYCVSGKTANDFVNFNNGFGLLPGNAIRNYVSNTLCIGSCLACLDGMLYPGTNNKIQVWERLPAGRAMGSTTRRRSSSVSFAEATLHAPLYGKMSYKKRNVSDYEISRRSYAAIPGASKIHPSSGYTSSVYPTLQEVTDTGQQ